MTGGIAALNHRLPSGIPSGCVGEDRRGGRRHSGRFLRGGVRPPLSGVRCVGGGDAGFRPAASTLRFIPIVRCADWGFAPFGDGGGNGAGLPQVALRCTCGYSNSASSSTSGIPAGMRGIGCRVTGGIAALNHRLPSGIPSGCGGRGVPGDRWYRCAQPPATFRHPFGMREKGGCRVTGGIAALNHRLPSGIPAGGGD